MLHRLLPIGPHIGLLPHAVLQAVGHAYAASGNRVEAQKAIDELKVLAQKRYVPALYLAPIYGRLGEKDEAMRPCGGSKKLTRSARTTFCL